MQAKNSYDSELPSNGFFEKSNSNSDGSVSKDQAGFNISQIKMAQSIFEETNKQMKIKMIPPTFDFF